MYLVKFYGNIDSKDKRFRIRDRAEDYLRREAKKWCKANDVDIFDAYDDDNDYFYYGIEDYGVCIGKLYDIPKFDNKIEELLWDAKLAMDMADFAAEDYKWSLTDCCVDCSIYRAKEDIDKALNLIKTVSER